MKNLIVFFLAVFVNSSMSELFYPGAYLTPFGLNYTIGSSTLPNGEGEGAGIWLAIDNGNPSIPILRPDGGTLGISHVWYETTKDTIIDAEFATNTTSFYSNFDPSDLSGEIQMNHNEPFIMAFRLGGSEPSSYDIYGWAELMYDGSDLHLLDSAAENDGVGIIAGQYVQVPEPSSVLLLTFGSGSILFYRRAKRRQQYRRGRSYKIMFSKWLESGREGSG